MKPVTYTELVERIERAAAEGRGLRLDEDMVDQVRCLFELSLAADQAQLLDEDFAA